MITYGVTDIQNKPSLIKAIDIATDSQIKELTQL